MVIHNPVMIGIYIYIYILYIYGIFCYALLNIK